MDRDLLCFSHLRWDFVYQRPNHLMARAARDRRVFFIEEPSPGPRPGLDFADRDGVSVVTPRLPEGLSDIGRVAILRELMTELVENQDVDAPVHWFYTPMAFTWSSHLPASAVVYDVMDELSHFRGAPPQLIHLENVLLARADLAFTGGRQLFESKRTRHPNVHLFPSSVDVAHFRRARANLAEPPDQAAIGRPRLGYYGVLDERIDLELLRQLADRRPGWQIVLVGPTAKIDEADLPRAANIHYLGMKPYAELPTYLAGWDVALMPFALNDATRFISPTKTPEYLAGGRPVASTSIRDVVDPYGVTGLVHIGDGLAGFEGAVAAALARDVHELRRRADAMLSAMSWDRTWAEMDRLVSAVSGRHARRAAPHPAATSGSGTGGRALRPASTAAAGAEAAAASVAE